MQKNTVLSITPAQNGHNYSGEKETIETLTLVVQKDDATLCEVASVCIYMGRSRTASKVYASIWVHCSERAIHTSGTGSAGGYGYCKQSAATAEAMKSAGIKLEQEISGRGLGAVRNALAALAEYFAYEKYVII